MTRVVLVRHGESLWNAEGRLQGQGGTRLSPLGERQAQRTAEHLSQHYAASFGVCSDLERVLQTAQPWAAAAGVELSVDKQWREIDVGTWSGLTWEEVGKQDPDTLAAWRAGSDVRRGGGETFAELRARVAAALGDLAGHHDTVVVFTSGGCIRLGAAAVLGVPVMRERVLGPVANCSITELRLDAGEAVLLGYNLRDHLRDLEPQGSPAGG